MSSQANLTEHRRALEKLLRRLADAIANLDPQSDDFRQISRGEFRLDIVFDEPRPNTARKRQYVRRLAQADYADVVMRLRSSECLEIGAGILADTARTKRDLEVLSRQLGLPVNSKDRVQQIRQRILDATIGFRLRSRAIRSNEH